MSYYEYSDDNPGIPAILGYEGDKKHKVTKKINHNNQTKRQQILYVLTGRLFIQQPAGWVNIDGPYPIIDTKGFGTQTGMTLGNDFYNTITTTTSTWITTN